MSRTEYSTWHGEGVHSKFIEWVRGMIPTTVMERSEEQVGWGLVSVPDGNYSLKCWIWAKQGSLPPPPHRSTSYGAFLSGQSWKRRQSLSGLTLAGTTGWGNWTINNGQILSELNLADFPCGPWDDSLCNAARKIFCSLKHSLTHPLDSLSNFLKYTLTEPFFHLKLVACWSWLLSAHES
jgi:hypothetical protein